MKTLLIQEHDPKWKQDFKQIKNIIQNVLEGIQIQIEHVGSTSIPDLSAKPIIDIDIIYLDLNAFSKIKAQLSKIGYYHNGDQGVSQREVFIRKDDVNIHPILDKIRHHLYACPSDSVELNRHILFRDFLIKNDWAKIEYESLKFKIAKETDQDHKLYAELKEEKATEFISKIIELAKVQ